MLATLLGSVQVLALVAKKKPHPTPTLDPFGPGFTPDEGFGSHGGFTGAPVLLFIVGLAAVGLIGYLSYRAKQERIAAFKALAAARGMTYSYGDTFGLLALPFALMSMGDGRDIENVLSGKVGDVPVYVFDYWYYEESTDAQGKSHRSTYRFDCFVGSYDAAGASLTIDEENLLTILADAVALDDLQFESEEFNRAFNVKSDDARFANAFVDARMMQWLLERGRGHRFAVSGDRVLVAQDRLAVQEVPALLETSVGFLAQIPRVVASLYPKSG